MDLARTRRGKIYRLGWQGIYRNRASSKVPWGVHSNARASKIWQSAAISKDLGSLRQRCKQTTLAELSRLPSPYVLQVLQKCKLNSRKRGRRDFCTQGRSLSSSVEVFGLRRSRQIAVHLCKSGDQTTPCACVRREQVADVENNWYQYVPWTA